MSGTDKARRLEYGLYDSTVISIYAKLKSKVVRACIELTAFIINKKRFAIKKKHLKLCSQNYSRKLVPNI